MQLSNIVPDQGTIGSGPKNAKWNGDMQTLYRAGYVDTGDPGRMTEELIVDTFATVADAVAFAQERTAGAEQAAAAVVELVPGEFTLQRVQQATEGGAALGRSQYHFEGTFGSRSYGAPTITDPAVKALVDGRGVILVP